jgi:hypothetical protein
MATARPELLYLTGPQAGQRAVLMENRVVAGRSPQADVVLAEQYISRKQLQFHLTAEGWVVENLSTSAPIEINGKRFRPGKQVALETGDVLVLGRVTRLLFVQPGDDPEQALAAWRKQYPDLANQPSGLVHTETSSAEPPQPRPQPEPIPVPAPETPAEPARQSPARKKQPSGEGESDEAIEAKRRRKKMILYGSILGASVLSFLVLLLLGSLREDEKTRDRQGPPKQLAGEDIRDALTAPLQRAPNEVSAEKALREARQNFQVRSARPVNLYLCVKNYRLYLAFRRPERRTFEPADERYFQQAQDELAGTVHDIYVNAIVFLNRRQWARAYDEFQRILDYLPIEMTNDDDPVRDTIIDNVRAHLRDVSRKLTQKNG